MTNPYMPDAHACLGLAGTFAVLLGFTGLGVLVTARRSLPEIQVVAGWGLACIVLTVWGVATPAPLRIPAAALGMVALACLVVPPIRERIGWRGGEWRMFVLSVPLWLVVLPLRPSQYDTWMNLLPNAAYLFNHDMLPTAARPESWSFLPVAPYNTQFAAYLASSISGAFAEGAMGWFNIGLLLGASLLLARKIAGPTRNLPWSACAMGALLAMPLNPGFAPRTFLSAYGEPSLAVTTMFAVWLAADVIHDLSRGVARPSGAVALALVLAALINIKQSGPGIVLPIGVVSAALAALHPKTRFWHGLVVVVLVFTPSLILYAIWHWFAVTSFTAGELKLLPLAHWDVGLLPQILAAMAVEAFHKATLFLCLASLFGIAVYGWRRNPWSHTVVLVSATAGTAILFNGFLLFTYIAHFSPASAVTAHSYYRYNSQLSLAMILCLVVVLRPLAEPWLRRWVARWRVITAAPVALAVICPLLAVQEIRIDLTLPQPLLWDISRGAAKRLAPGEKVALLVPGDVSDSVGSLVRGVIMFTPPGRPNVSFRTETTANAAILAQLPAAGSSTALITCTPPGLSDVPAGVAALLRYGGQKWRVAATWPIPPKLKHKRFSALLAGPPLCAAR